MKRLKNITAPKKINIAKPSKLSWPTWKPEVAWDEQEVVNTNKKESVKRIPRYY